MAFGDSHSAGAELLGSELVSKFISGSISAEEMDSFTKPYSYPNLVAENLGIPCYNYSMSGSSNARSIRLLPKALADHPDSLVLFTYTESHRSEIYFPDRGKFLSRDSDNYLQIGIQWEFDAVKQGKFPNPVNTYFVEKMLRVKHDYSVTENNVFYVDQACKNLALDHLHIFGHGESWGTLTNDRILDMNLFSNGGYGDFQSWCRAQGYKSTAMDHYPKQAHKNFADFIINALQTYNG